MTNQTWTTSKPFAARPSVLITSLVAALAASVGGCASSLERHERTVTLDASIKPSIIPPEATMGRFDRAYFEQQAAAAGAPAQWASQAGDMVTAIQAQRAMAEATRLRAKAQHESALAQCNENLAQALAQFESAKAQAERLRSNALSAFEAQRKTIAVQRVAFEAEQDRARTQANLAHDQAMDRAEAALVDARRRLEIARAEHDRLIEQAQQYAEETRAGIEQIRASSESILEQAKLESQSLHARIQAIRETAGTNENLLEAKIDSNNTLAQKRHSALQQQAEAVRQQAQAEHDSIIAQIKTLENWDLGEGYQSAILEANAKLEQDLNEVAAMRDRVTSELGQAATRLTAERKNIQAQTVLDGQSYERELAKIESDSRIASARASIFKARAQELEHDARAQFIRLLSSKIDQSGRVDQGAAFQQAQELVDAFGREQDMTVLANVDALQSPEVAEAIEQFLAQLGESKQLALQAEQATENLRQQQIMRRSQIEVWWSERQAASKASLEAIAQTETETIERLHQQAQESESLEARAHAEHELAMSKVESEHELALARKAGLYQKAEHILSDANTRAEALERDSEQALVKAREHEASLRTQIETSRQQAEAKIQSLSAQAEQILADAQASAAVLEATVTQAEESLAPELAKRESNAQEILSRAELELQEAEQASKTATVFADNAYDQEIAQIETARSAFDRDQERALAQAEQKRESALAEATSILAQATESYSRFQAQDASRRAEAQAVEDALLAFVDERHTRADAQEAAVFAEFSARLATFSATQDQDQADAYFKDFLAQANLTPADLKRFAEAADDALGRLGQATQQGGQESPSFEHQPGQAPEMSAKLLNVESKSIEDIATVPTNDDQ